MKLYITYIIYVYYTREIRLYENNLLDFIVIIIYNIYIYNNSIIIMFRGVDILL